MTEKSFDKIGWYWREPNEIYAALLKVDGCEKDEVIPFLKSKGVTASNCSNPGSWVLHSVSRVYYNVAYRYALVEVIMVLDV